MRLKLMTASSRFIESSQLKEYNDANLTNIIDHLHLHSGMIFLHFKRQRWTNKTRDFSFRLQGLDTTTLQDKGRPVVVSSTCSLIMYCIQSDTFAACESFSSGRCFIRHPSFRGSVHCDGHYIVHLNFSLE